MFFLSHIWLIPLLPAAGAALMFFFGSRLEKAAVNAVCVGAVILAFMLACACVWQYTGYARDNPGQPYQTILYTWLGSDPVPGGGAADSGTLNYATSNGTPAIFRADAGFLLDPLSSIWLLFVTGVGMLIHIYSIGYMAHEHG
ncbi:MAG TPA: NADH-quinone oxidoreductase subunit L, partial [Terriglobales bacterium]|nr:NADH-quinone oxidoreductase subunit L [Terriglobales bacterium]